MIRREELSEIGSMVILKATGQPLNYVSDKGEHGIIDIEDNEVALTSEEALKHNMAKDQYILWLVQEGCSIGEQVELWIQVRRNASHPQVKTWLNQVVVKEASMSIKGAKFSLKGREYTGKKKDGNLYVFTRTK